MYRLRHDVVGGYLRQLLPHQVEIQYVGVYEDVLLRQNPREALIGLLQLRLSAPEEVNELLGVVLTARGPEPTAFSSGQYHAVIVVYIFHFSHPLLIDTSGGWGRCHADRQPVLPLTKLQIKNDRAKVLV